GTGLSSHELNQPGTYRDVKDTTVVAQFRVLTMEDGATQFKASGRSIWDKINLNKENLYALAWTTTPWTLPSNTALAVGSKISYVLVRTFNQYTFKQEVVILAKDLLDKWFKPENSELAINEYSEGDKKIPYEVIDEFSGKELTEYIRAYEPVLKYAEPNGRAFKVITGDFVSTEDGTGIVHIAPTFGADDARVAKLAGVEAMLVDDEQGNKVPLVDLQGRFRKEVTDFAGEYVREEYYTEEEIEEEARKQGRDNYLTTDERISIKLKEENKAFRVEKYVHSYPHCWRTDKPILYYPLDSWFVRTTDAKERLIELNSSINWKPESTGTGRFGNWLENLQDWNLSRSRFWGIPLPIWTTEDKSEVKCIGSAEELKMECEKAVQAKRMDVNPLASFNVGDMDESNYGTFDMHRPYMDDVVLVSDSGKPMHREADLIDVWFDSGAMPYAQLHYPFENKDQIDGRTNYPADFIAEGVDQTRGWFFTLHAIAAMCFDTVAYKNVVSNGLVLDKQGQKMSKRLGNAADPFETLKKYGPDATRWYMITNAEPWDNLKFNIDGIGEVQRKFFGTLYNTYGFYALYANIDGYDFSEEEVPIEDRPEIDRWIISKLNSLIAE
ncbi:MAG: class I tRNA ligase family protein, partial [Flavobacteriales bacterium]|nr:class I tRNA ligase family protein [Flavobacteriales bacterium]